MAPTGATCTTMDISSHRKAVVDALQLAQAGILKGLDELMALPTEGLPSEDRAHHQVCEGILTTLLCSLQDRQTRENIRWKKSIAEKMREDEDGK